MSDRDDLRIAWAPARPGAGGSLTRVDHAAGVAAASGATLLLLPEAELGGPQPSDGPGPGVLAAIAQRHRIAIVAGYLEEGSGGPFSSALVLDRDGHAAGHARRSHDALEPDDDPPEAAVAGRGGWLAVVPLLGRRLGLIIGADLRAPEVARALVLSGADLLVALRARPAGPVVAALATARAAENRVPLLLAEPAGGLAVDARGVLLERSLSPLIVPAALPGLAAWRRPELYRALLEPGPERQASSISRR